MMEEETRPEVEKIEKIYFAPPESIYDFLTVKVLLRRLGVRVDYTSPVRERDYRKLRLYALAPEKLVGIVEEIIKTYGGKISDKEILVTDQYFDVIIANIPSGRIPIGVASTGNTIISIDIPSRIVVAGDPHRGVSLMISMMHRYLKMGNRCCLILGSLLRGGEGRESYEEDTYISDETASGFGLRFGSLP